VDDPFSKSNPVVVLSGAILLDAMPKAEVFDPQRRGVVFEATSADDR